MKKIINIKEIMIILISVLVITFSTTVFASDLSNLVLGNNNNTTTITGNEYDNAQTVPEDNNTVNNTTNNINNNVNNNVANNNTKNNTVTKYNTNNSNNTDLPQTGIEDYNVGILLVICIASAIFAYKKITDYKNI